MKCPRCQGTGQIPDARTMAERLVILREERKLATLTVAHAAKISQVTLHRLEHGRSKSTTPETLIALADFYKVTVDFLVRGKSKQGGEGERG